MGEGFFSQGILTLQSPTIPPWLAVFLSVLPRHWTPPPATLCSLPHYSSAHTVNTHDWREKLADGETLSTGILGNVAFEHQLAGASHFHHKCSACVFEMIWSTVYCDLCFVDEFKSVCVCAYFLVHACAARNPTANACVHDQQKEPAKLTVSLLMSFGRSPAWAF